jgi:hypothetical protein
MKKGIHGLTALVGALVFLFVFAGCENPANDDNGGDPALSGNVTVDGGETAQVGIALTADTGGLGGTGEIRYQWQRGDEAEGAFTDIEGADEASYTPETDDEGKYIRVAVSRAGYSGTKTSPAAGPVAPEGVITWTAEADGEADITTSTKITFTFTDTVEGLTVGDISVTGDTGTATKGTLNGDDTTWTLDITVETAGAINVSINKAGIESGAKSVAVFKLYEAPVEFGLYRNTGTETERLEAVTDDGGVIDFEDDLNDVFAWLAENAEDDTEYVVLLDDDYMMNASFVSKSDSTGVRIILRGLGQTRDVYWDENKALTEGASGVFRINAGTTLVFDTNFAFGYSDEQSAETNTVPGRVIYLNVTNSGGRIPRFEMRGNSRISRVRATNIIYVFPGSYTDVEIVMRDSAAITNNTVSTGSLCGVVYITTGNFTMQDNALISGNTVEMPTVTNANVETFTRGGRGAVTLPGGTFTMTGNAEISNTINARGVYLAAATANMKPKFYMNGGRITGNGKECITQTNTDYYIRGGGVYIGAGPFVMTGGEISGNGNSGTPGSGIWCHGVPTTTITTPFMLNGAVTITDSIAFRTNATKPSYPFIGSGFSTASTISIDLCIDAAPATNFEIWWKGKQLLYPLPEGGATIDADLAAKFEISQLFIALITSSNYTNTLVEDYTYTIDEDGIVAAVGK